ncbi:hypothetical protein CTEN210_06808 [Chaetoceros tenuissimus]|nr:hypothetical protein CTEN210_06808 [Chaetoceros tenuissimus]
MRVSTVDGLLTLFYDGSKPLYNKVLSEEWNRSCFCGVPDDEETWQSIPVSEECKRYVRERQTWQQVIIVDGVTEIPEFTFYKCKNIGRVIFAKTVTSIEKYAFGLCVHLVSIRLLDSVIRIENHAFTFCMCLKNIKLPPTLEYIGDDAFEQCNLVSVFIPPRCRYIGRSAFEGNLRLTILSIPQNTELNRNGIIGYTNNPLQRASFERIFGINEVNTWLKDINGEEQFALHRICSSFEPTLDMILDIMMDKGGPKAFKVRNSIGITPSRYLHENPYTNMEEREIIQKYVLKMMGEL